jgi:hypothetical protein
VSLTNVVNIFEQLFGKDVTQKIMNEPSCYAQKFQAQYFFLSAASVKKRETLL